MKKLFILLSNLLASLFFVWVFTIWSDTYVSHYYPNIAVHDSSPETTFQQVTERLEKLAKETDSFIAIQHQDPTSEGTTAFSYTTFGEGKLPVMQIIKGQVPVRGIISLILIGQLLAVIIVTLGIGSSLKYSQAWLQHRLGKEAWSQERQLIILSISREGTSPGFDEQTQRKLTVWYNLMDQAVSEQKAILSRHQLIDRLMQNGISSSKNLTTSTEWQDYSPNGNVLIVTPQYLERQNIPVDTAIEQKLNHLAVGEFILLLPEHLRSEEEHYKSVFEDDLTSRMSSQNGRQQMTATVAYLESGQDRFVYNTTPISYQQFLKDPIIIVVTPQSTGPQSVMFWFDAVQNYVLFNQLSDAQELIQRQGIENWVSEMQSGYHNYITLLNNIQRERWIMLAGAVLGIATSILLFNTMNRLYFEEFRRAIVIKRIAGLRFLEIHRNYLLAQLGVFLLGFVASVFLQVEIVIAFLVLLLFTGLSLLQLHVQMQKENKMSMLVLKGG